MLNTNTLKCTSTYQFADVHVDTRVVIDLCLIQINKVEHIAPHVVIIHHMVTETLTQFT